MPATTTTIPRGTSKAKSNGTVPAKGWTPELHEIPVASIDVGANVRTDVGDISGLVDSIKAVGILEPIRVAEVGAGKYELVYGQRRLAAAKDAGLATIPAVVDAGAEVGQLRAIRQLIENLQREDLNPLEEAQAYAAILKADSKLTQAELAKRVGRAAPTISNSLRLLELDPKVLPLVRAGKLTGAHAKALAGLKGAAQRELAEWAASGNASAHALEQQVKFRREQATRDDQERAKRRKVADEAEAELVKLGASKETSTIASGGYYGTEVVKILKGRGWPAAGMGGYYGTEVVKILKGRGWPAAGMGGKGGKTCDCEAFAIDLSWDGKLSKIKRACVSSTHQEAARKEEAAAWETKQERDRQKAAADAAELEQRILPLAAYLEKPTPAGERLTLFALVSQDYATRARFVERRKIAVSWDSPMKHLWTGILKIPAGELAGEIRRAVADHVLHSSKGDGVLEALEQIPEALPPATKPAKADQ